MTRPTTLPEPWRSLADRLGGVGALADALRVAPSTVYRWARGQAPVPGPAQVALEALAKAHGVPSPC